MNNHHGHTAFVQVPETNGEEHSVTPSHASANTAANTQRDPVGHATPPPVSESTPAREATMVDVARATYFDVVMRELALSEPELALLRRNGFVVSDRLAFKDFQTAYAYLHWKDLPVLITTDALLHAINQTYDDLLLHLEASILRERLKMVLRTMHEVLRTTAEANTDPDLVALYADLNTYLEVPVALLDGYDGTSTEFRKPPSAQAAPFLDLVLAANRMREVALFGGTPRPVDFTLFQVRGHYADPYVNLEGYFRAMTWLAQVDFRFVDYTPHGTPTVQPTHIGAAVLLREILGMAAMRGAWEEFDALFTAMIGRSDNVTLHELDRFLARAGINSPREVLDHSDLDALHKLLSADPDAQQRITGQLLMVAPGLESPLPRPISFMFIGHRFSLESYIMSQLVYDRLIVAGEKVQRPFPQVLDVWYALGSDRAAMHLEPEFSRYHYADALQDLRDEVDRLPRSVWTDNLYCRLLLTLRTLQQPITEPACPPALRTPAWADKMLQTTLAAWTQARQNNVLHLKQSVTVIPICEYPAGFVEPYPAFFAALADYAQNGDALFAGLQPQWLNAKGQRFVEQVREYFAHLAVVVGRLEQMAEKALHGAPWTEDEVTFLKDTAVRKAQWHDPGCSGIMELETWQGWYPRLLPWGDDTPAVVADVHTNPSFEPRGVLHVGTGRVATVVLMAGAPGEETLYCGPALTYFEFIEQGLPPRRLSNEAWRERLETAQQPAPPTWTGAFRMPSQAVQLQTFPQGPQPERRSRFAGGEAYPIRTFLPGTTSEKIIAIEETVQEKASWHPGHMSFEPHSDWPAAQDTGTQETQKQRGSPLSAINVPADRPRVLVVDDRAAVRLMYATTLEHGGFAVMERTGSELRRSLVVRDRPDVVVLDWTQGGEMRGVDLLMLVRSVGTDLPIVVCAPSGVIVPGLSDVFLDPAVVHLQTPVSASDLWAALHTLRERHQR